MPLTDVDPELARKATTADRAAINTRADNAGPTLAEALDRLEQAVARIGDNLDRIEHRAAVFLRPLDHPGPASPDPDYTHASPLAARLAALGDHAHRLATFAEGIADRVDA